ncbi:MAG: flagellar type III secretion system pore protein FliP [Rhodobacteraceae bacterium]|nr:flagellar type III secretion system pore protein FliP [Paracoccaceae bacterium]
MVSKTTVSKASLACLFILALSSPALAQSLEVNLGDGGLSLQSVQLFLILTLLSLAPGIAMMVTCFPFMVIVLSIMRQAIGVQQAPPNMMIVSLALFLTWFVMAPVFNLAWAEGVVPYLENSIDMQTAINRTLAPFRVFMEGRVQTETVDLMLESASQTVAPDEQLPLSVLVPSFLLSEIQRGFEIGFLIFLPFLVIDLVIAAVLMSMGMMMVPPAIVALPFKLAFFVIADGWSLIAGALVSSYS